MSERPPVLDRRRAGILLHPTSLPGGGDLGAGAHHFVDFLCDCGASVWQMLPVGPPGDGLSPYQSQSVHAGNPRLISLEALAEAGWLAPEAARAARDDPGLRAEALQRARAGFEVHADEATRRELEAFTARHRGWLEDYALFEAIREAQGGAPWWRWPPPLRDRDPAALAEAAARLAPALAQQRFEQFAFERQWSALRGHAARRGVRLFGDMPLFVAQDGAEVWAYREGFRLDAQGRAEVVAGVPPDLFSETGQRWGNPHYAWARMREDGFRWWHARLATELRRFDLLRVDHFRGLQASWEIPASARTAVEGRWVEAPGAELFAALEARFERLPLVAEDLGYITPEVHALRERFALPGMKVLQFAFDGSPDNPYLPHNHEANAVAYPGTHDNDTARGWFEQIPEAQRRLVCEYLAARPEDMPWPLLRAALASVARLAVLPMQDVMGLGGAHRLNTPGTAEGNWTWRFTWEQVPPQAPARLRRWTELYGRTARAGH